MKKIVLLLSILGSVSAFAGLPAFPEVEDTLLSPELSKSLRESVIYALKNKELICSDGTSPSATMVMAEDYYNWEAYTSPMDQNHIFFRSVFNHQLKDRYVEISKDWKSVLSVGFQDYIIERQNFGNIVQPDFQDVYTLQLQSMCQVIAP